MQLKRVVITGLGAITPLGNTVTEYWNNLINGVNICTFTMGEILDGSPISKYGQTPVNYL